MHVLRCLSVTLVAAFPAGALRASPPPEPVPDLLIGYTEHRTDLPGGRYVNSRTRRAVVVRADGTGRRAGSPVAWCRPAGRERRAPAR